MKWFLDSAFDRRLRSNPYTAAAAFAARHPRPVLMAGAVLAAGVLVIGLIAVSSVQAFVAVSQGASAHRQLLTIGGDGETAEVAAVDEAAAAAMTSSGSMPTAPVGRDQTVVVYGIRVHASIAANLRALIDDARADGIVLSGWGWRDSQSQIRLRRQHCGTSRYAIYDMPSSRCRPPTARPGRSQHERGLAIDFTYNGGSISTRRNPGFRWLSANAAEYGLKNLASEPWHWSTTGR